MSRKFQDAWLVEDDLKDWLRKGSSDFKASCCFCCKEFDVTSMGRRAVTSHMNTAMHKKSSNCRKNQPKLFALQPGKIHSRSVNDVDIMKSEMYFLLFFVEHNVAFQGLDHSKIGEKIGPDSNILKKIQIKRTKGSYLLNDAMAPVIKLDLQESLRNRPFSLCIDESNEFGNRKFLEMLVSFIDSAGKLRQQHFYLDEISDGKANTIFNCVKEKLSDANLSISNLLCCMTDSPNVMIGQKKGFLTMLRKEGSHILDVGRCSLHHVANSVKHACNVFGNLVEDFADDVSIYFLFTSRWTSYSKVGIFLFFTKLFTDLNISFFIFHIR